MPSRVRLLDAVHEDSLDDGRRRLGAAIGGRLGNATRLGGIGPALARGGRTVRSYLPGLADQTEGMTRRPGNAWPIQVSGQFRVRSWSKTT